MTPKIKLFIFSLVILPVMAFSFSSPAAADDPSSGETTNPVIKFLKDIEYTTRITGEYDDNIFLVPEGEEADYKTIFTQALKYNKTIDDHFFKLFYFGNYEYFTGESVGIWGHTASAMYSYRPAGKFSFGIGNDFNWLEDSAISAAIGDRLLALGYTQVAPFAELKYEATPRLTFITDVRFRDLDVANGADDDFIDNERKIVVGQFQYALTSNQDLLGFAGFEYDRVVFSQIFEKSAMSYRPFVGFIKKLPGVFHLLFEVGFDQIEMDDNADDDNTDFKVSLETVFSVFTKFTVSYIHDRKNPSLRREYTQYGASVVSAVLDHTIDPKTSVRLGYSYEKQDFSAPDALIGQLMIDRDTKIHNANFGFNRKLNEWLTFNINYDYTKRKTDFANESYNDNKVSAGLTARY